MVKSISEINSQILTPAGLTPDDVLRLKAFFPINQHQFDRGMIYIREEAISNRLDAIDPSWSFEVVAVDWRKYKHCVVTAAITIKGVRRENTGENEPKPFSLNKGETQVERARREAERSLENIQKAATTDALKRCARLFGLGRYLLSARNITDERKLKAAIWGKTYNPSTQLTGEITTAAAQDQTVEEVQPEPPAANGTHPETITRVDYVQIDGKNNGKPFCKVVLHSGEVVYSFTRQPFRDIGVPCAAWEAGMTIQGMPWFGAVETKVQKGEAEKGEKASTYLVLTKIIAPNDWTPVTPDDAATQAAFEAL